MKYYLWHVDAIAIGKFTSLKEAEQALKDAPDPIKIEAFGEVSFVPKKNIKISPEEEFEPIRGSHD